VPKDLERVTMKLLERHLPARYATAEQAIHDLLECSDAPKDGRDLLSRTLAERFPQHAPVRGSVLRSKQRDQAAIAAAPTVADGSAGRRKAAAQVSLGAAMAARTGTLAPTRRRRIALVAVGVLASAALAFAIVTAATAKHDTAPHETTGSGSASGPLAAHGSAIAPPVPDAPPAPPPASDAGTVDSAAPVVDPGDVKKDATPIQRAHPGPGSTEKRLGNLTVLALPALTVTVDHKRYGDTPQTLSLPIGKHSLRLQNLEAGRDEILTVTITENHTTTIDRRK
jgi:hypothetical protein